jgi:hypothetical protein
VEENGAAQQGCESASSNTLFAARRDKELVLKKQSTSAV